MNKMNLILRPVMIINILYSLGYGYILYEFMFDKGSVFIFLCIFKQFWRQKTNIWRYLKSDIVKIGYGLLTFMSIAMGVWWRHISHWRRSLVISFSFWSVHKKVHIFKQVFHFFSRKIDIQLLACTLSYRPLISMSRTQS